MCEHEIYSTIINRSFLIKRLKNVNTRKSVISGKTCLPYALRIWYYVGQVVCPYVFVCVCMYVCVFACVSTCLDVWRCFICDATSTSKLSADSWYGYWLQKPSHFCDLMNYKGCLGFINILVIFVEIVFMFIFRMFKLQSRVKWIFLWGQGHNFCHLLGLATIIDTMNKIHTLDIVT